MRVRHVYENDWYRRPVDVENNWDRVACNISTSAANSLQTLMSHREEIISSLSAAQLLIAQQELNISSMLLCS